MWDRNQNQNYEIFPGQKMDSYRFSGYHDENLNLAARSDVSGRDFMGPTSRKRKLVDYCGHAASGANSEKGLETKWSDELSRQHRFGVLSSSSEQGNKIRGVSNITSSQEAGEKSYQPGRYQSHGLTNYELNSETNQMSVPNVVADMRDNLYSARQQYATHQSGPTNLMKAPAAKIPTLPSPQSVSFTFLNQIEVPKHSYPDQAATNVDKSVSSIDSVNFGHTNNNVKGSSSSNLIFKTSEVLSSSEASQHNYQMFSSAVNSGERNLNDDIYITGSSFERRPNDQALNVTQAMDTSVGTSSIETARVDGNATEQALQNYISELRVATRNNIVTSQVKPIDQIDGNQGIQNMNIKELSPTRNENHSSWEDVSLKDSGNRTNSLNGTGHGDGSEHASKLGGESKPYSEKASSITEKLWDGTIQLSTAVTVSAVAFFKSGEKAPEINWSEFIVVKGKVRLEAFEKFIQELPRSRSRGLMVTSLCWKAGSSTTGLTGMKEVAKGYKERDKVGYAQISRGIDLYVCPRSDAIITILAKYGFFKGMAALEMDQDSLIGCVVWRRNQPSSESVTKKSQNENFPSSDEPLNSTSNTIVSQTEPPNTPFRHPEERFSPIVSKNYYTPHNIPDYPSIQTGDNQVEVGKSASTATPEKIHVAPQSSPSVTAALNSAIFAISQSLNSYMSLKVETPIVQNSGPEKPHTGSELPRRIRPVSPQKITGNREAPVYENDDDDLPEFDFSSACGISQHTDGKSLSARKEVPAVPPRKEVPTEGADNASGSMHSVHATAKPMSTAGRSRPQEGSQKMAHGVSGVSQSNHPARKSGSEYSQSATMPSDEKTKSHGGERQVGTGNPTTKVTLPSRKSMWDDDDMPEWCPPDLEHQGKPTMMSTTQPSAPCIPPSPFHHSNHPDKLPGPPPRMATSRPYASSAVPSQKSEDMPPGPPMATTTPVSPYTSSVPSRTSVNMPPDSPPQSPTVNSNPPRSYIPPPTPSRHPPNSYVPPPSPFRNPPSSYVPPPTPSRNPPSSYMPPPSPSRNPPSSYMPPPTPSRNQSSSYMPPPSPSRNPPTSYVPPPTPRRNPSSSYIPPPSPSRNPPSSYVPPPTPHRNPSSSYMPPPSPSRNQPSSYVPPPNPSRNSSSSHMPPPSPSHNPPTSYVPPPTSSRNPSSSYMPPPSPIRNPPSSYVPPPTPSRNPSSSFMPPPSPSRNPSSSYGPPPTPSRNPSSSYMPPPSPSRNPPSSYVPPPTPSRNSYLPPPPSRNPPSSSIPPPSPRRNPPSSYMPPPTPSRNSQNIPLPVPIPPPANSKPSFSYISSPAPRQNSENTLPGPPQLPSLPPPPPLLSSHSQFHTQARPVGIQPPSPSPSLGFTYNPTSRPQSNTYDVRPPAWRDWGT